MTEYEPPRQDEPTRGMESEQLPPEYHRVQLIVPMYAGGKAEPALAYELQNGTADLRNPLPDNPEFSADTVTQYIETGNGFWTIYPGGNIHVLDRDKFKEGKPVAKSEKLHLVRGKVTLGQPMELLMEDKHENRKLPFPNPHSEVEGVFMVPRGATIPTGLPESPSTIALIMANPRFYLLRSRTNPAQYPMDGQIKK